MSKIYFCGLTGSKLMHGERSEDNKTLLAIDKPTLVSCEGITDIEIGWDYFLIWKSKKLYVSGRFSSNDSDVAIRPLEIPEHPILNFKQAIAGSEKVTVLMDNHEIWTYDIRNDTWTKVPKFTSIVSATDEATAGEEERITKIGQGRCSLALTDSGRVFNIPMLLNCSEAVRFIDVACGFDHTLLLASTGDVYSVGMGTRGQLGHGDLEDCDEPKLIEALAGLKVIEIAAAGWHSAVITDQGDLYTWGWNNQGQLGQPSIENIAATPTLVEFKRKSDATLELNVIKVQCGNAFTICKIDSGDIWGCGSNKYGQLGLSREDFPSMKQFIELKFETIKDSIKEFKCREWGTCIYTK